ncbi:sterol desaturase family protein [Pseudochryseolinea flava]|uniref:Sterol desaturase family protein n=1 Tax=Pseudochryseolinea flava TaxID=2059302 RepID=A0A364Y6Z1_9BACT|nr:sterol desaturase family protein [Pseudochryseolinea flava]RAW02031.1 sterol desaturase family protein [Pseudochryseolinea flava]
MDELFGAKALSFHEVELFMRNSPNIIVYAAPVMFFFVLLEYLVSLYQNRLLYKKEETLGSILVGLGNVGIGLLIKTLLFFLFALVYNLVPWRMSFNWWTFIPCYIIFDFLSYWTHRFSHHIRFFWASHVPHHSGEQYNLSVSFRLSWVQYIKIIFVLPIALIGFHPVIIFITNQVAVLFQFWVHTEYIKCLHPAIEYVFATPSNHRVHHGSQRPYINKNFAATFILWDRIFGTFQKEEADVTYGITHNIQNKSNPLHINFHEHISIIKDVVRAKSLREALFYIFGDPEDVGDHKNRNDPQREVKK